MCISIVENKFNWCLRKEKADHRGIRKIEPNEEESKKHIEKALHNLKAFDHNKESFSDWAVSMAFYAMYHALLAILFKLGYESRNQECTINAVEYFLEGKKIDFDIKYIRMIRTTEKMLEKDVKSLREEFQYGTNVSADAIIINYLRMSAIEFVEATQICLEKLK